MNRFRLSLLLGMLLCLIVVAGTALAWRGFSPDTFLPLASKAPTGSPTPSAGGSFDFYDIGTPTVRDLWVDPLHGNDDNDGSNRAQALRTVTAAWGRIPQATTLSTTGYRLQLVAGTHKEIPTYWESRWGTYPFPIILNAADGPGTAILPSPNLYDVRYLYLIGLQIRGGNGGDGLHCELCDHVLLRRVTINGNATVPRGPQEALKVNQSRYLYVEESDIFGGHDNAVDFVAVQDGHFYANTIHDAEDWCMYLKGGSAYFRVEGNRFFDCGHGFTAGQGTGFEYMVSPWLHYEAYDIKFVNNIVHDVIGAGFGINGGYNILLAHNTLYRVGQRSHVIEVVFGRRGCDGAIPACQSRLGEGGWGTTTLGQEELIPNRNVHIFNNIVYNPPGYQSEWQHFAIYGPVNPAPASNIPAPARTDVGLIIRGNLIWNGPASHPLGVEDSDQGCQPTNPTCTATQLLSENNINQVEPELTDPANGNFRPVPSSNVFDVPTYSMVDFQWGDAPAPPTVPQGRLNNAVTHDYEGNPRTTNSPPGAYAGTPPP